MSLLQYAKAVKYGACVCTTALQSGLAFNAASCNKYSLERFNLPSICSPFCKTAISLSVNKDFLVPDGVIYSLLLSLS